MADRQQGRPPKRSYDLDISSNYDLDDRFDGNDFPSSASPYLGSQSNSKQPRTFDTSPRPTYSSQSSNVKLRLSGKRPGRGLGYEEEEVKFLLYHALYLQTEPTPLFHAFKLQFPDSARNKPSLVAKVKELKLKMYDRLSQKVEIDYEDDEKKEPKQDPKEEAYEFMKPDTITNGINTYFCFYKDHFNDIKVGVLGQNVRFMLTKLEPVYPVVDGEKDFFQTKAMNQVTLDLLFHQELRSLVLLIKKS